MDPRREQCSLAIQRMLDMAAKFEATSVKNGGDEFSGPGKYARGLLDRALKYEQELDSNLNWVYWQLSSEGRIKS